MTLLTSSGAAVIKAGSAVSTSIPDDNGWVNWISGASAYINTETRYNWSTNYATLSSDVVQLLDEAASNIVAGYAIIFDMSGYPLRLDAQTALDYLNDRTNKAIKLLKDKVNTDFMIGA